jgi:hypothetical protein
MNNTGINFSWLWVYGLGALIGLLAAEVIEKIAKSVWVRIGTRRQKLSLIFHRAPICNDSGKDARTAHNVGCNIYSIGGQKSFHKRGKRSSSGPQQKVKMIRY